MLLEICANSYQSAINAQEAGAHRIELCSELAVGGITPSHGGIEQVMRDLTIPVFVLIRPRSGDFSYTESEFETMLLDIAFCKSIGVQGIVSGVLLPDFTIDKIRTQQLIEASTGMAFTFHRAFDWVADVDTNLKVLIDLGVNRILTSGQQANAIAGLDTLKDLKRKAGNALKIMPGGGVNITNIDAFIAAGFDEIHTSASSPLAQEDGHIPMYNTHIMKRNEQTYSDPKKIKALLDILSVTSIKH